jgi:3-oxoacyl-[acyl-carrier protein] reductase
MTLRYDFTGRTAVVTGGSRGIGRGIATGLRDAGATVWNWSTSESPNDGIAFHPVDVADPESIAAARRALLETTDVVDILVNNAGLTGGTMDVDRLDPAIWRRVIDVNLTGTFEVTRALLPELRRSPAGRIVNLASIAGKEGPAGLAAYGAAKAGVIAFTKAIGKELAGTAIRVNCITPAATDTEILSQLGETFLAGSIARIPMGRLGKVEEVTGLTLWLASDACTFSTGAVFDISGGRSTY